jgi:tetratricopeptide (TPR) repeat protein
VQRLEAERDNVRAALTWAVDSGEADIGLRTAAAVWTYWPRRGLAEGRASLERLLALPQAQGRDAVRARALTTLGNIELWQNDYEVSRACLEEAAGIARELGDPRLLAYTLSSVEVLARAAGDLEGAMLLAREALVSADAAGDPVLAADFRGRLGLIEVFSGNPELAIQPLREATAVLREAKAASQLALSLASLGTAERLVGDLAASVRSYREALEISLEGGNMVIVGTMAMGFAFIASSEGRHERAARLVGAAERIRRDAGGGPLPELLRRLGDPEGDARRAIGDEAFERARAEGFAMDVEEAVSYAVGDHE